jgi:hypothetical protein
MTTTKDSLPYSSRFASSVEDLVRAACIEEGSKPIQLGRQSLDELKVLSSCTQEMKDSFNSQLNICNKSVVGAEKEISIVKNDLNDVKIATEELVTAARNLDSITPISLGEQNLSELKQLSSETSSMKDCFNVKLDNCNQTIMFAMNETNSMKKDIENVKTAAGDLVRTCSSTFTRSPAAVLTFSISFFILLISFIANIIV